MRVHGGRVRGNNFLPNRNMGDTGDTIRKSDTSTTSAKRDTSSKKDTSATDFKACVN